MCSLWKRQFTFFPQNQKLNLYLVHINLYSSCSLLYKSTFLCSSFPVKSNKLFQFFLQNSQKTASTLTPFNKMFLSFIETIVKNDVVLASIFQQ
ncbi:MAG: hypothetical protein LBC61_05655 [Candidatus Peribacteria bacterium]|nr:hypothetical protein [Candidatus Peribacteria bacterium]